MHQTGGNFWAKAAALVLNEVPLKQWHLTLSTKMSTQAQQFFADENLLCDGCAPPTFNIPPPPRPPWMENEDCQDSQEESLSEWLSQLDTCDSTLIRDSQSYFEDTFHSIAIIVVSAIVLVIFILSIGLYIFKRRKSYGDCPGQQRNDHRMMTTPRFVGNVNPAIDCATPTHLSHTLGPVKPRQVLYEGHAVTSLTSSGHTITTRCLAMNHYIPDHHHKMLTLDPVVRKQQIADEFKQRFGTAENRRNVMELSERPPMAYQPTDVYQNDYPHIVIGGKPFFLVPSTTSTSVVDTSNSEAYAYPQHMPIYEEIDYNTVSAPLGSGSAASCMMMMDRPLSSTASHSNNSAHTNTSELSSGGDSSTSSTVSQKNLSSQSDNNNDNYLPAPPTLPLQRPRNALRMADGLPRSPLTSGRLSNKSQPVSTQNSVYYYSDTLKKPSASQVEKVNTKVTLDCEKETAKNGSTLV